MQEEPKLKLKRLRELVKAENKIRTARVAAARMAHWNVVKELNKQIVAIQNTVTVVEKPRARRKNARINFEDLKVGDRVSTYAKPYQGDIGYVTSVSDTSVDVQYQFEDSPTEYRMPRYRGHWMHYQGRNK